MLRTFIVLICVPGIRCFRIPSLLPQSSRHFSIYSVKSDVGTFESPARSRNEPLEVPTASEVDHILSRCYTTEVSERREMALEYGRRYLFRRADEQCISDWDVMEREDQAMTYGEFDISFFSKILLRTAQLMPSGNNVHFCDVGSGAGRIVLATALLEPNWSTYSGIEVIPELDGLAKKTRSAAQSHLSSDDNANGLERCEFYCEDMTSEAAADVLRRSDVIFCYSTCLTTDSDGLTVKMLSDALSSAPVKDSAFVITVDTWLSDPPFTLLAVVKHHNDDINCVSTGFIWKVAGEESISSV